MPEMKVRGLPKETLAALSKQAARRGISREELTRSILETAALTPAFSTQEERYQNLVKMVAEVLASHTKVLERLETALRPKQEDLT